MINSSFVSISLVLFSLASSSSEENSSLVSPSSVQVKWADFGFYGNLGFKDLDYKLEFSMDNYEIISIEKCTGNGGGKTVREKGYKNIVKIYNCRKIILSI